MHKNCFIRLITLGIIFLSLISIGWAEKKPAWGNPETGLLLKYQLPQNQVLTYRVVRDLVRTVKTMGQSFETNLKYDSSYSIKGVGLNDQNNLMLQITINGINCSMSSPQGNTKSDNSGLKGKSFNAIHSTNGKQLETTDTEDLPKIVFLPGADLNVKYMFEDISTTNFNEDLKINSGGMQIPRTTRGKVETELVL